MRRASRAVVLAISALLLTSCNGPAANSGPTPSPATAGPLSSKFPPRPREIPVGDIDPCSVLSSDDLRQLGVAKPERFIASSTHGELCQWHHSPAEPVDAYLVELVPNHGIEDSLANPRGVTAVEVAGFAALETQGLSAPEDKSCAVVIDMARGQSLSVSYYYNGALSMDRGKACVKARTAAELAMKTLLQR